MLDLYDAVGHGMWAYSNAAFRVDVLDRERFEPAPGTLVAVTHRRETDVPVICPPLYFAMGGTRRKTGRLHFAARDDMFLPGFFAGFPPELRCGLGGSSTRSGSRAGSPPSTSSRFAAPRSRASGRCLPPDAARRSTTCWRRGGCPTCGSAPRAAVFPVPRGPRTCSAASTPTFSGSRSRRGRRRPRGLLGRPGRPGRRRFPHPRPDRPGRKRPRRLPRGKAVAGRGDRPDPSRDRRPRAPRPARLPIRPLAIAYDPLVRGRPRVHLALGDPVEPPKDDVEGALLALLRLTMPLTCGQFVSTKLEAGAEADPVGARARPGRRGGAGT